MNLSRVRVVGVALLVLAVAACSSHPAPRPAASSPAAASSPSAGPVDSGTAPGYVAYGQPLGAPIPDLVKDRFARVTKLAKSRLVGPAYGIAFSETVVTTTITAKQQVAIGLIREDTAAMAAPMVAAAGSEFIVAQIGSPPDYTMTGKTTDVTWSLAVGTRTVAMPPDFRATIGIFNQGSALVVGVATGADAVLSATDDGRTQGISLRTGQVKSAGASTESLRSGEATFSTVLQMSGPGIDLPAAGGLPHNGYAILVTVHAALALNADGHPTARAGRAWLILSADALGNTAGVGAAPAFSIEIPLRTSLKIYVNGTSIKVPHDTVGSGAYVASGTVTWVVDVPRTLTTIEVGYAFTGSVEQWSEPAGSPISTAVAFGVLSGRTQTMTLRLS